jgi:outer membrane protein assembly factor BamD (BamD/ComL family)
MSRHLFIITLLLLAVNLFSGTNALAAAILKAVNRSDESARLQLSFHFDQLPGFNLLTNGRRIDLKISDTTLSESLVPPATDGKMIKMVSQVENNTTTLTFYFRYPPQKVSTESNKNTGILILDILLGNQLSVTSPDLSAKLRGGDVVKEARSDSPSPIKLSPFAQNWRLFFTQYESPLEILPSPKLHMPPFPLAAALPPQTAIEKWLSEEIQAQVKDGKWLQVCQLLREQVNKQPDEQLKERLVLTYAEALIRAGEYRDPYFLLQRIMLQYPDSLMADLARFLLIYQQADRGDYTNAYYELHSLLKKIEETPFIGSFNLLLAELALMAGLPDEVEKILANPAVSNNESLKLTRLLRQADLLSAKNQKAKALTDYLNLASQPTLIDSDPMSLARFADALYTAKRYPEAAKRYQQLGDLLNNNRPGLDLVLFRLAMCHLHMPATEKKVRIDLQQIQNAFAGSKGGARALIKQTDLDYVANKMAVPEAESMYGKYAVEAESISLREEAALKQALVNALAGEGEASVNQCMELLRGFQSGNLRTEAMALLIQQLPGVIRQMVKNKEYVKALVLAKQNKMFFARGWIEASVLYDLAQAYSKLGLADQTAQTYQYIFEVTEEANKEKIYLPLIQALFSSGHLLQAEEYADRYQLRYPKGSAFPAIFALKIRTLYASGQLEKALKLLTSESSPRIRELEILKGRIFFENKEWQKVIDTLAQTDLQDALAQNSMLLPLAESYFQTGKDDQALTIFQRIKEQEEGSEQAQYRLAQIALKKDNKQQALILFKELAEKGKDPLWAKLAREEAAILEIEKR